MGDTHTPLKYNFTAIILNIIFNFLLIYPSRDMTVLGVTFPMFGAGLGVAGAAWGTALSLAVSALLLFLSLCDKQREIHLLLNKEYIRPDKDILKKMVFLGVPTAMEQFITTSGQVISTRIVSTLGTVAVARQYAGCFSGVFILHASLWSQRSHHNAGQPVHRCREKR